MKGFEHGERQSEKSNHSRVNGGFLEFLDLAIHL